MPAFAYQFRPVSAEDLPLLEKWLNRPHVREWWGDPVRSLAQIEKHFDDPAIDVFMVSYGDIPIGYQQSWDPHAEADHPCRDQPMGTRGIDQFIGEPDFVGRGHGSAFIRVFVERLFEAGAPRVVTDPNPRNARAIRAYTKAGISTHWQSHDCFRRSVADGLRRKDNNQPHSPLSSKRNREGPGPAIAV